MNTSWAYGEQHKTIAVIQARTESKRLPKKIFSPLAGIPILGVIIHNLRRIPTIDEVWVATSEPGSDRVGELAQRFGARLWVGHATNVLSRYTALARHTRAQRMVRATGDNPFVVPENVAEVIHLHKQSHAAVAAYTGLPLGTAVESLASDALLRSEALLQHLTEDNRRPYEEHVSTFVKENKHLFTVAHHPWPYPITWPGKKPRLTIDEAADLQMAQSLAQALTQMERWPEFELKDIQTALAQNPRLVHLNEHINQRPLNHAESVSA